MDRESFNLKLLGSEFLECLYSIAQQARCGNTAIMESLPLAESVVPFRLYLSLREGANADVETVARAAIQLSKAFKEVAFLIDPSTGIKVEFVGDQHGSLGIKTLIRAFSKDTKVRRRSALLVAVSVIIFLLKDVVAPMFFEETIKKIIGDDELTKEEIAEIVNVAAEKSADNAVKKYSQKMVRELRGDPAITGVGAELSHVNTPPKIIIPRSDFDKLAGIDTSHKVSKIRSTTSDEKLLLLSPFLENERRKWKFLLGSREIGAYIKDINFLSMAIDGRLNIKIMRGIEMDVVLETKEEFRDEVWVITGYNVVEVKDFRASQSEPTLPF